MLQLMRQCSVTVCNAQFFLTLPGKTRESHKIVNRASRMPNHLADHLAAPASSLPSLMMPCPVCAGRMAFSGRRIIAPDVEDTVYACKSCGAELVRTSVRRKTEAKARKTAA
jgi:predicted RNA-binding Zn-ribbon protein involved in translation (DUF1610 family)